MSGDTTQTHDLTRDRLEWHQREAHILDDAGSTPASATASSADTRRLELGDLPNTLGSERHSTGQ